LAVARRLGCPFLDFDAEIERRTGLRVADLFAQRGEASFRALERGLTQEVAAQRGMVLAPGGGWMADSANRALMTGLARIIHLRVSPAVALARLGTATAERPLLAAKDPLVALTALWEARAHNYREADAQIDTEVIAIQEVTEFVVGLAAGWGWPVG
jgi:shikimate kinase